MEAQVRRRIKSGAEYDNLFPGCTGEDRSIKRNASVEDTLQLIRQTVPQTLWHTEKIAKLLEGDTLEKTCSNIWHFVYGHVQYKKDDAGYEQIRSPRRTWRDREEGGDCDDYSEFISSVLMNLGVPHKARIAIYDYANGYQHIYIVVPKDGKLNYELASRRDYIVLDCVKDAYDDEQPFLEKKDYNMKLQYLDGIPTHRCYSTGADGSMDAQEFGELWATEQEFGGLKDIFQKVGDKVKEVGGKVLDKAGDALRTINKVANPATILLRNGFLAAMKVNLFNVADKLRFGYLTEDQARKMNMNLTAWKKLNEIKNRAETIYYQAGGEKAALRKAILEGKGNNDRKVPLIGFLNGFTGYGDETEQRILSGVMEGLSGNGLGEPVTAAMITAASGAIAALGVTIKQIGGLFNKGTPESAAYDSAANAVNIPPEAAQSTTTNSYNPQDYNASVSQTGHSYTQTTPAVYPPGGGGTLPAPYTGYSPDFQSQGSGYPGTSQALQITKTEEKKEETGVVGFAKKNAGILLITGVAAGTIYALVKSNQKDDRENALSGLPQAPAYRKKKAKKRRKTTKPKTKKTHSKKVKISAIKL